MKITLYKNFSKKINSTKQPSGGAEKEVYLKDGCSVENPIFLIDGIDLDVNYVKFNDNYFYVNDIILSNNNIYEIHCSMDTLASHKAEILNTTAYVKYSQSRFNKWIPDERLSMTTECTAKETVTPFYTGTRGSIIITIANNDDAALCGMTSCYAVNINQLYAITTKLYGTNWSDELSKIFGNPYSAIIEAHWVPFHIEYENSPIYIGQVKDENRLGYGTPLHSWMSSSQTARVHLPINWNYNDWRDAAPYSSLSLTLPFIGTVNLDVNKILGESQVDVQYSFNVLDGSLSYVILSAGDTIVQRYETNLAVPLSIGQASGNKIEGATQMALGSVATGAGIAEIASGAGSIAGVTSTAYGISQIASGIKTFFTNDVSGKGTIGNFASPMQVVYSSDDDLRSFVLTHTTHIFSQDPADINAIEGRPLYETVKLSTLSGYVKCEGASVNMSGLEKDKEEINGYLNGPGIFIE